MDFRKFTFAEIQRIFVQSDPASAAAAAAAASQNLNGEGEEGERSEKKPLEEDLSLRTSF